METPAAPLSKEAITCAAEMLGDTWSLLIVNELLVGSKRFGEIQDALDKISPQTLSQRLKMLEKYGFVLRQAYAEIPPRVEYQLTDKGLAIIDVLRALADFAETHLSGFYGEARE